MSDKCTSCHGLGRQCLPGGDSQECEYCAGTGVQFRDNNGDPISLPDAVKKNPKWATSELAYYMRQAAALLSLFWVKPFSAWFLEFCETDCPVRADCTGCEKECRQLLSAWADSVGCAGKEEP